MLLKYWTLTCLLVLVSNPERGGGYIRSRSNLLQVFQSWNEMLIFGLRSTSDDGPGWSMNSNPFHHPCPAKQMKCSFLDYVQLLMIGQAGRWTQTPSTTPVQPKKWNACFWITFNFWWLARLVDGLKPHLLPLSSQKNEMLVFGLRSTSGDRPSNLSNESQLKCDKRPPKSLKNEILIFINYVQLLMIGQAIRVMKVDQNAKKWHVVSVRVFCCFSLGLLYGPPPPRWQGRN